MESNRRYRVETSERACNQCRNRKTRCIVPAGNIVCSYCARKGKDCVFGDRPERTPLTRKNLDAAESRCRELEFLLQQQQHVEATSNAQNVNEMEGPVSPSKEVPALTQIHSPDTIHTRSDRGSEWQNHSTLEDASGQDGMASLTMPGKESGYLGSTSGSILLQSLSVYLSPKRSNETSTPQTTGKGDTPIAVRDATQSFSIVASGEIGINMARDHFINAYFVGYNSSYPIVHERTFREDCLRRSQIPAGDMWHVMYYVVLAVGEWVSGHSTDDQSLYYEAAHSRLGLDVLESGNMGLVQALLLMGNYLQKRDRPNTAYNFIGIAYRVALGLGLHRELPAGHGLSPFALQRRRALFWTLYCFDSGFSMTTGRPTLVSDMFIDIRKPLNIEDTQFTSSITRLNEVSHPTVYSAIIAQARLAVIANKVYGNFLSVRASSDVEDLVATMEQTIRNWRSSLPSFFFSTDVPRWFLGPRQVLFWKEANLQIALLLASQRNHLDDQDKMLISSKCQNVAITTIMDISSFCLENLDLVHVGACWYAVYFLLHALLALGLHQLKIRAATSSSHGPTPNDMAQSMKMATSKARECLEILGRNNRAAVRTLQILDRIEDTLSQPMPAAENVESGTRQGPVQETTLNGLSPGTYMRQNSTFSREPDPRNASTAESGVAQNIPRQSVFMESPPEGIPADCVMNDWVGTTDPSFHFFLDNGTAQLDDVFSDLQGFPNVADGDNFDYLTSTMHSIRVPEQNAQDWERYGA